MLAGSSRNLAKPRALRYLSKVRFASEQKFEARSINTELERSPRSARKDDSMNTSILRSNNTTVRAIGALGTVGIAALPRWIVGNRSVSAPGAYPKHPR